VWSSDYRDPGHSDCAERVDGHDVDEDDDDADDSYGAYETTGQLLDTLTEYQQKLEKTNFIDEATADEVWTPGADHDRGPVPLPRRRVEDSEPRSSVPAADPPESPSDSIDVSELEEDEYLDS